MQPRIAGSSGRRIRPLTGAFAMAAATVALCLVSMLYGGGDIPVSAAFDYLVGDPLRRADPHLAMVMTSLRFPRTAVALCTGIALGLAGCLLQSVTRNPLAETGLLGVNAGAALAVVAGITLLSTEAAPAVLAFALCGAFAASGLVLLIAGGGARMSPLRLVLAGVALTATFRGLSSYLLLSDAATYDRYRFWVLGSLSGVTLEQLGWVLPALLIGVGVAALLVRPLGALSLGDDVAAGLGHRPGTTRVVTAVAVTLLTGAAVALCGPIGFLGLLAPYVARAFTGGGLGGRLLLSAVAGATIMLAADVAARLVIRPYEAPVSVLLAVIGGPALVVIVRTRRLLTLRVPGGAA
ncbi:iron complex transport system permease protein [Stackebrandtia albiflava]|uniref:Iron complex transport system permease protein n=1 Tax=Stackebrandtia albiflava TaxID=406432 RepID=A0A562VBI1_9ACTN|nr:iron ABC transporter permease [Stackebrandtia albiflava]TWJ15218.1 iron complex transport system permease protein [Stackebrandtia albiflava]